MTTTNGTGDLIRRTLKPLIDEDAELEAREIEATEALAQVKAERKIIRRLLQAGGLIEKPEPKPKANGKSTKPKYVSEAMIDRAREFLPDGEFTARQASEAMETSEMTAGNAIRALRDAGEVRLVGKRVPDGSGSKTKAAHYARVG